MSQVFSDEEDGGIRWKEKLEILKRARPKNIPFNQFPCKFYRFGRGKCSRRGCKYRHSLHRYGAESDVDESDDKKISKIREYRYMTKKKEKIDVENKRREKFAPFFGLQNGSRPETPIFMAEFHLPFREGGVYINFSNNPSFEVFRVIYQETDNRNVTHTILFEPCKINNFYICHPNGKRIDKCFDKKRIDAWNQDDMWNKLNIPISQRPKTKNINILKEFHGECYHYHYILYDPIEFASALMIPEQKHLFSIREYTKSDTKSNVPMDGEFDHKYTDFMSEHKRECDNKLDDRFDNEFYKLMKDKIFRPFGTYFKESTHDVFNWIYNPNEDPYNPFKLWPDIQSTPYVFIPFVKDTGSQKYVPVTQDKWHALFKKEICNKYNIWIISDIIADYVLILQWENEYKRWKQFHKIDF